MKGKAKGALAKLGNAQKATKEDMRSAVVLALLNGRKGEKAFAVLEAEKWRKLQEEREAFEAFERRFRKARARERKPEAMEAAKGEQSTRAEYVERCKRFGALRFGVGDAQAEAVGALAIAGASQWCNNWEEGSAIESKRLCDEKGAPILLWRAGRKLRPDEKEELENIFHCSFVRCWAGAGFVAPGSLFDLQIRNNNPLDFRALRSWWKGWNEAAKLARAYLYGKGAEKVRWEGSDLASWGQLLEMVIECAKAHSFGDGELTLSEVAELKTNLPPAIPSLLGNPYGGREVFRPDNSRLLRVVSWAKWCLRAFWLSGHGRRWLRGWKPGGSNRKWKAGYRSHCEFLRCAVSCARGNGLKAFKLAGLEHLLSVESKQGVFSPGGAMRERVSDLVRCVAAGDLLLTNEPERMAALFVENLGPKIGKAEALALVSRQTGKRAKQALAVAGIGEERAEAEKLAQALTNQKEAQALRFCEVPGRFSIPAYVETVSGGGVYFRQSGQMVPYLGTVTRSPLLRYSGACVKWSSAGEGWRGLAGWESVGMALGEQAEAEALGVVRQRRREAAKARLERKRSASFQALAEAEAEELAQARKAQCAQLRKGRNQRAQALALASYCAGLADKGAARRLERHYQAEALAISKSLREAVALGSAGGYWSKRSGRQFRPAKG